MILIKGAGDLASGIAVRLYRAGYQIVMDDLSEPSAIRRTVAFSDAIRLGSTTVEHITAVRADTVSQIAQDLAEGTIPVFPISANITNEVISLCNAVIDGRLAKINIDTAKNEARVVIGIGPGFTAGVDCHAVIETKRGHFLGRVLYNGRAEENTGIPGIIGGYGEERVMRSPCEGIFRPIKAIGDFVEEGETVAFVGDEPMKARIAGMIRGLLPDGFHALQNMKSGDVDPRSDRNYCDYVSDKAMAVGGGVLEALLHFNVFPDKTE